MSHQPTEEELRAAYEQEIKQIRVEHVLVENVVTLVNLGMRRTGLIEGTEDERDPAQVRLAIESVRSLLPQLEQAAPEQMQGIRQALSQLQLAYVQIGGGPGAAGVGAAGAGTVAAGSGTAAPPGAGPQPASPEPQSPEAPPEPDGKPGEAGPAQRSGRLWVPGQ
jgi:hypothetical protein